MTKRWTACTAAIAVLGLVGCDSGDGSSGDGGYTQVGDVSLDGVLGGGDASDASDSSTANDTTSAEDGIADGTVNDSADTSAADVLLDGGPSKYPQCLSLIGCVAQSCPAVNWAVGCDDTCLTGASATVATSYSPVSACIQSVCRDGLCKGSSDPKCIGECIGQKCLSKIAVCGADGKTGSAICGSYFTCSQGCGADANPLECVSKCYAALSTTAQSQYAAVDACSAAAGGSDAFASCPEQVLTCLAGGASGSGTCIDALTCSGTCDTGTDAQKAACMTACWAKTDAAAQTAFAGAMKCNSSSKTGCVDSMMTCLAPNGTATCTGTLTCAQGCNQTDAQAKNSCFYGCLHAAKPAEAKKVLELQVCMSNCNCKGDKTCENTCISGPCKAELTACQAP